MANLQESGKPGPAKEQSQEEIKLAQELRGMMDELLGDRNERSFSFTGRKFYVPNPGSAIINLVTKDGFVPGVKEGSPLDSREWPNPKWTPTSARISREGDAYTIEVKGSKGGMKWNAYYGVRFTLRGDYPRIDYIIPENDPRSTAGDMRPWKETSIPAEDSRLRPRIKRLEYGIFLASRIKAADSGAEVLP